MLQVFTFFRVCVCVCLCGVCVCVLLVVLCCVPAQFEIFCVCFLSTAIKCTVSSPLDLC